MTPLNVTIYLFIFHQSNISIFISLQVIQCMAHSLKRPKFWFLIKISLCLLPFKILHTIQSFIISLPAGPLVIPGSAYVYICICPLQLSSVLLAAAFLPFRHLLIKYSPVSGMQISSLPTGTIKRQPRIVSADAYNLWPRAAWGLYKGIAFQSFPAGSVIIYPKTVGVCIHL